MNRGISVATASGAAVGRLCAQQIHQPAAFGFQQRMEVLPGDGRDHFIVAAMG